MALLVGFQRGDVTPHLEGKEWPDKASMEEELAREASEVEEEAPRTSSTAQEVEEEIVVPTSASVEEDTTGPVSTSLDMGEDHKQTSLSPSEWEETSESAAPQALSLSGTSSLPVEESGGFWSSSTPPSPATSPLPWKGQRDGLQSLGEEGGSEGRQRSSSPTERKAKKKALAKKGALNYTVRPVVPAEKAELVAVAKAMHRDNFGRNVKELFHLEREAALKSMETGLYIGWRCPEYLWDCFRVGDESKCFCGHLLKQHQIYVERRATVPCTLPQCKCPTFTFVPSRPEEVGEFWLKRRTGFDPAAWRAKCRCKHTHEDHAPLGSRACEAPGCSCGAFASSFLCAACDRCWEEHETFFESEETRRKGGRPYGEAYLPFAEMPELCNAVLTGRPEDDSAFQALQARGGFFCLPAPSGSRPPLPLPPSGPPRRMPEKKDDRKA
ncbi:protein FAM221B [Heteronotia binoei]|uniref:protein FAM221B n=1 Tax=Heteronotia binoei TaxID=13085 RepID=UPI00292F9A22|nr:protein FAM221B [Heteronotia binoei]